MPLLQSIVVPVETLAVAAPAGEWTGFAQGHQGGQQSGQQGRGGAEQNRRRRWTKPGGHERRGGCNAGILRRQTCAARLQL